jgi:hypothetical protein
MTNSTTFDPSIYYSSYPERVISRPGYPARAAYKSTLIWSRLSRSLPASYTIRKYADVGGCFGFGANALAYHIQKFQPSLAPPKVYVYELSSDFANIGTQLFPSFTFVTSPFGLDQHSFDLVSLFDVVEHIVDPQPFLSTIASRSSYILLNTPLETNGFLGGNQPLGAYGENHPDGHVNFFTCKRYEELLHDSGLEIVDKLLVPDLVPPGLGAVQALSPEISNSLLSAPWAPKSISYRIKRRIPLPIWPLVNYLFGRGNHLSLCKSRLTP